MANSTFLRRLAVALAVALLTGAPAASAQSGDPRIDEYRAALDVLDDYAERPACDEQPDPARWLDAGTPDRGLATPLISAHRGALTLAPENTVWSYEYAFAYGVPLVEVDVQQTRDGRFVALHDSTVDRTTDGTGEVSTLTYAEIRRLNAADYEPWKGTEFDPARVASLEEVLALARRVGGGLELDIKGSVTEEGRLAELVGRYGLIEESIFNSADVRVLQAEPAARLIYNRDEWEPPFLMYEIGRVFNVFGSRLDEYTPESIAAVHDACGVVMPHAYDAGPEQEVAQFLQARAIGADGVQTNQPDRIVAAAGLRVRSRLVVRRGEACLVNARNGLGFPAKQLGVAKGRRRTIVTTGLGGCAEIPRWSRLVWFRGDDAVRGALGVRW
jgi:glycerophosphoryl diester phosphodiesterase